MFSKALQNKEKKRAPWPDLRYNLATGEAKLFLKPEDVPKGWVTKPRLKLTSKQPVVYDKQRLINQLQKLNVTIDPKWGVAHLKKVLDDVSPAR